jgi:hypothetical protein
MRGIRGPLAIAFEGIAIDEDDYKIIIRMKMREVDVLRRYPHNFIIQDIIEENLRHIRYFQERLKNLENIKTILSAA